MHSLVIACVRFIMIIYSKTVQTSSNSIMQRMKIAVQYIDLYCIAACSDVNT